MKVSKNTYETAGRWIKRNARPLEEALWSFYFENGSANEVINRLESFQNEDGGFGHGIEPDFWTPDSSPMATWAAGRILIEIGADLEEKAVQRMIGYLVKTYLPEDGLWPSVVPSNNHFPHAPWWRWTKDAQQRWSYNPSAELAAFLVYWSPAGSKPSEVGWETIEKGIRYLMETSQMDRHEVNNFQQLVRIMAMRKAEFNSRMAYSLKQAAEKVNFLVFKAADVDKSSWGTGYKALPMDFVQHPDDPQNEMFGKLIDDNLDFYIQQLSVEGVWDISWSWGQFEREFQIARRQWQGILAVQRYKILLAFGRLEHNRD